MSGKQPSKEKGMIRNPNGNNGRIRGYSCFRDRAEQFCLYKTSDEIIAMHNDKKEMGRRNPIDVAVIKFIYNALLAADNQNLNDLFDRLFGKPKQVVEGKNENTTININIDERKEAADKEAENLLKSLAARMNKK